MKYLKLFWNRIKSFVSYCIAPDDKFMIKTDKGYVYIYPSGKVKVKRHGHEYRYKL